MKTQLKKMFQMYVKLEKKVQLISQTKYKQHW
jgi:hypothetical protein